MTKRDGIRDLQGIMDRCRVDEFTGCWVWAMGGDGSGRPSLWLPALERRVSLGVAICVLRTGKPPAPGVVWHCTCSTPNCANPKHRAPGTRSSQMKAAKLQRDALTRARIAQGKRAASELSDTACAEIRASAEPLRIVADRHGISTSHASKIRRGELRQPVGFSIFTLGLEAAA